jgi:rare lipoprotein A
MKKVKRIYAAVLLAAFCMAGYQQAFAECGIASTYSSGSITANGERYNHMGISAAHKTLPFGTRVVVRNQRTGRAIEVRINDRGPYVGGRIIDLSTGAKKAFGMDGLAHVCLEVVSLGKGGYHREGARKPVLEAHKKDRAGHTRTASVQGGKKRYAKVNRHKKYAGRRGRKHHARGGARHQRFAYQED